MAEQLGGSRGRNDNMSGSKLLAATQRPGMGQSQRNGGGMGGILSGSARPMTARGAFGGGGIGSPGLARARPSSAPKDRPSPHAATYNPDGARARVEEARQLKEAQYWGREQPIKRELPPYWSVTAFGQPFNDERLFNGANNHYQLLEPQGLKKEDARVVGPATEQQATLRKSLRDGKRYFEMKDFAPLGVGETPAKLAEPDRVLILSRMTACQRIHALRLCMDRDTRAADFTPWTQMVWDRLDGRFWKRNKEMAIRLAVQKLENMMRRHLLYLSEQRCAAARAPAARTKDVLREAFWKVDPGRTGHVSVQQFLQVWQNVLCLLEYSDSEVRLPNGRTRVVLVPGRRFLCDLNMTAGVFVKYGFDKDGLMPYVVFSQALCAAPARLLGQELVLDKKEDGGKHGLSSEVDIAYCIGDAKIIYPKCDTGVFPPSGFDPRAADRSRQPPTAHMWLEHVYGYAGMDTLQSNVFYTHNTQSDRTEVVYYTGCVGIVFNKELFDKGLPCQKYFFGHDNDILCLGMHPTRKFVATGQQKATGPQNVPFVCVWDVDNCNLLQRLDHEEEMRSVLAVCFSGNINAVTPEKQGGDILITITSDDRHTIHLWKWMNNDNKFCKARHIPGWYYGPGKKVEGFRTHGHTYVNPEDKDEQGEPKPWLRRIDEEEAYKIYKDFKDKDNGKPQHPLIDFMANKGHRVVAEWEHGFLDTLPRAREDGTWTKIMEAPGCNGTPPMIYGASWNPLRPQDGRRGSEFCTYGVKHLKSWIVNDEDVWQGTSGSFGTDHIENVLSAIFVPALHYMAAPGDSCILTGFASGMVGLWIPPYPTRAGSSYTLTRKFRAHGPGQLKTLTDGTQQYMGVRAMRLRADPKGKEATGRVVVTGGSDGCLVTWDLEEVSGSRKDGTPLKGVNLRCRSTESSEVAGPNRYLLQGPVSPCEDPNPPSITALDCHPSKPEEFIAGTDSCDIWEVDESPRILVEGHEEDIYHVATHPTDPFMFATGAHSGTIRLWDMKIHNVVRCASIGFPIAGIGFSNEPYKCRASKAAGLHLAVGSAGGYNVPDQHRILVLDVNTLQPLKVLKDPTAQIDELKYSPASGPGILAAGGRDMTIYLYNANAEYQLIGKCVGHSGNVEHIDWSLPISLPGSKLHGTMIIQASDTSGNLLNWNPRTAKKIPYNQRDAPMDTWTCRLGFPVMGVWPDDSDRTDINSVCRAQRGAPAYTPPKDVYDKASAADRAGAVLPAPEEECADGVPGCSYLATGDDFSTVRLFNYPVVWDDAPYKAFRGHASHVMTVRFNSDDRYIVSAGGHDRGIFQWRTCGIALKDQAEDKKILAAWYTAVQRRGEKDSVLEPNPGVEWVALDETGKTFGPKAVQAQIQEVAALTQSMSQPLRTLGAQSFSDMGRQTFKAVGGQTFKGAGGQTFKTHGSGTFKAHGSQTFKGI